MNLLSTVRRFILLLLALYGHLPCEAQIFVNARAVGTNDGTSWENAFTDLQDGLNAANENDQVWIAAGTYIPDKPKGLGSTAFLLTKGVKLYGGFNGTESKLVQRNPSKHLTILSGDINQDDIDNDFQTNRSDNARTILLVKNRTKTIPLIDGLIFEGGQADGAPQLGYEQQGGGLFTYGSIVLRHCIFRQNYARKFGGALFFCDSLASSPSEASVGPGLLPPQLYIDSCLFTHNLSGSAGGAVCCDLVENNIHSIDVRNTSFISNKCELDGGAVGYYVKNDASTLTFYNCAFEKNEAENGGAVINLIRASAASVSFSACDFANNTCFDHFPKLKTSGGAIRISFQKNAAGSKGLIEKSHFFQNRSELYGGAVFIESAEQGKHNLVTIDSCLFEKNTANGGGGVAFMANGDNDSLWVHRSIFYGNRADDSNPNFRTYGGAVLLSYWNGSEQSGTRITGSSFRSNSCAGEGGGAVGISLISRTNFTTIYNCRFDSNYTTGKGAALFYPYFDKHFELEGCTFYDNIAIGGGDILYQKQADPHLFFLFFHGAVWLQILYSLVLFFMTRELTTIYYTILMVGLSVFFFFANDILHLPIAEESVISPSVHFGLAHLGVFLGVFGFIKYSQHYLDIDRYFPRLKTFIFYFISIYLFLDIIHVLLNARFLVQGISTGLSSIRMGIRILTLIGLTMPFVFAVLVYKKGHRQALFFLPVLILLIIGGVYVMASFWNAPWTDLFNIFVSQGFSLLALVVIAIANGYRTNLLKKEKERAERLAELDTAKTRLYNNITHEFRTPLTVIMGAGDLLRGNEAEKEIIHRNSKQLLQLINQMLDLSKLEAGALKLEPKQGDILPFIQYLVESFQSLAASKHIQLVFYTELESLQMDYDAEKIQAIISNLISNAIKFTPTSGKVVIHARTEMMDDEQQFMLTVSDSGTGIPEKDIPHIFDRFFQVDASDMRRSEGSGIGLALVKELVQLMKGTIEAKSKIGKGSVFTVRIPITNEAPWQTEDINRGEVIAALAGPNETERPDSIIPPDDELPLALIIEDNRDVIGFLRSYLQRKYQLEVAYNGREGIEKALELVPDIIISDVMMPEADGYTVCKTLKTDERTSHIPIILLTAKATQEDKVHGLDVGADAYLNKPFHREELEVRLQKLIELRQQLQKRYATFSSISRSSSNTEDAFILKLRAVVEEKMEDESFSINELCHAAGLSRMQVHRKLKALTGVSATAFIQALRLQKAYDLLSDTDLNVSEVAYRVGFSNHSYFTKLFVQKFGQKPSDVSNNSK